MLPSHEGPLSDGSYKVEIYGHAKSGRKILAGPGAYVDALDNYIPAAYNSESSVKVTISAKAAENRHDYALKAVP